MVKTISTNKKTDFDKIIKTTKGKNLWQHCKLEGIDLLVMETFSLYVAQFEQIEGS